jgi:hypothetical protein
MNSCHYYTRNNVGLLCLDYGIAARATHKTLQLIVVFAGSTHGQVPQCESLINS